LHAVLHLAGYDHEQDNGEMARKEAHLRKSLGLPVGLIERRERPDREKVLMGKREGRPDGARSRRPAKRTGSGSRATRASR
jgi:probable rRNA maturation factor